MSEAETLKTELHLARCESELKQLLAGRRGWKFAHLSRAGVIALRAVIVALLGYQWFQDRKMFLVTLAALAATAAIGALRANRLLGERIAGLRRQIAELGRQVESARRASAQDGAAAA